MGKMFRVGLILAFLLAAPTAWAQETTADAGASAVTDVTETVEVTPTVEVTADVTTEAVEAGVTDVVAPAPAEAAATTVDAGTTDVVADADAGPVLPTEPPKDFEEAASVVSFLIQTAKAGQWPVFAGLLIMLLIFVFNRFGLKEKVGAAAVPWVAAALGIAAQIALQLTVGIEWGTAIFQGFLAGATAVGLWELGFKFITAQFLKKADPA